MLRLCVIFLISLRNISITLGSHKPHSLFTVPDPPFCFLALLICLLSHSPLLFDVSTLSRFIPLLHIFHIRAHRPHPSHISNFLSLLFPHFLPTHPPPHTLHIPVLCSPSLPFRPSINDRSQSNVSSAGRCDCVGGQWDSDHGWPQPNDSGVFHNEF